MAAQKEVDNKDSRMEQKDNTTVLGRRSLPLEIAGEIEVAKTSASLSEVLAMDVHAFPAVPSSLMTFFR